MNEHNIPRILKALLAISKEFDMGLDHVPDAEQKLEMALRAEEPAVMDLVRKIESIVAAYLDTPNATMDAAARELINLVALGGRGKIKEFLLPVLDGPGHGDWACMVSPVEMKHQPVIMKPDQNVIRMPPRFRLK